MMRTLVLVLALTTACSKEREHESSAPAATKDVTGTLTVGDKGVTVTTCRVEHSTGTRITLGFSGGALTLEGDALYLYEGDDADWAKRGSQLTCDKLGGDRVMGSEAGQPAYVRGKLVTNCTAPTLVKVDLELACGEIPAWLRQRDGI